MFELWFFLAMVVGGPEHAFFTQTVYDTLEECVKQKNEVWAKMDLAYPLEEHKLYRFECKISKARL